MNNVLKRIGAYIIDITLVSTIATLLSDTPLNPNYERIEKINTEYQEVYTYYSDANTSLDELFTTEDKLEEKVIAFNENYPEYKDEIDSRYEDEKFDEDEQSELKEMIANDFDAKYSVFFYDIKRLSLFQDIFSMVLIIIYFVGFAYVMNGETLGKKIMKLRIVSNNDKKLSVVNYLLRTLLVSGLVVTLIDIILLYTLKESTYMNIYNYIYLLSYILELVIVFTSYLNEDNRGIHDLIANTKVIDLNQKEVESQEKNVDNNVDNKEKIDVKEIEVIEEKSKRKPKKQKRNK